MSINREFEAQIDAFVDEDIPEALFDLMRAISLTGLTSLVMMTPVDTGRARANWIVTIGSADFSYSESDFDQSGGSTIAQGTGKLPGLKADPFTVIYLQNNLPYIEPLEDGSSTQAPNGMVTITVANIESQFS